MTIQFNLITALILIALVVTPCVGEKSHCNGNGICIEEPSDEVAALQVHVSASKKAGPAEALDEGMTGPETAEVPPHMGAALSAVEVEAPLIAVAKDTDGSYHGKRYMGSARTAVDPAKVGKESREEPGSHEAESEKEKAFKEEISEATEALESESFSLSVFLMCSVGALMCVLHLLHWPNESGSVKATTLSVLNMTFSIFVAVLVYGAVKATLEGLFEPGKIGSVVMTLVLFVVLYTGAHSFLFVLKGRDPINLAAASAILAHITGFAAMYGFSDLQEVEFFVERGATGIVMVMFIAAAVIAFISITMSKVIAVVALADGSVDEDEERWIDVCKEADDDVICLAVSFLLAGLVRYVIRGKNDPYEPGKLADVTQQQCNQLYWCGSCSFWVVVIGAAWIYYKESALGSLKRVAVVFQHMMSMLTAWIFLFQAEWQIYVSGWESTTIGGSLVVACSVTFFSLGFVIVLDFCKEKTGKIFGRALKSASLALGVLIGFSWERCFDVAFEEVSLHMEKYGYSSVHPKFAEVVMSTILFLVVAPAWRFHILPPAIEAEEL